VVASASATEVVLTCASISSVLDRKIPVLAMQNQCNHALYSPGCGLYKLFPLWRNPVHVSAIHGCAVTAAEFTNNEDQFYRGGMLESITGEVRFIADHQGDTVVLLSPMSSLEVAQYAWAYWGCDQDEETLTRAPRPTTTGRR
jgi:hypothetical protein